MEPSGLEVETLAEGAESTRSPSTMSPDEVRPGAHVGRYRVLERVGHGGMGVVYCAYDPELNRKIALKLLRVSPGVEGRHSAGVTRLVREAQAMAKLSHPNVIAVHDVGEFETSIFVAMEFVDGKTLAAWHKAGPHPWRQVLALYAQAGAGLEAAHRHGIVHRDFKPENVMLGKDGRVRVLDFGLARAAGGDDGSERASLAAYDTGEEPIIDLERSDALSAELTRAGAVIGTPAYMAPEQHMGAAADEKSDQFAYCVALFTALYGRSPFPASTLSELAYKVTRGEVEVPPKRKVPRRIRKALLRGLSVDAQKRFPSMGALLESLDESRVRQRRTRWLVGGFGVAAAVAIGVAGWGRSAAGPCEEASAAMNGHWDEALATRLEAKLADSEREYAAETARRTREALDAYATRWRGAADENCVDSRVKSRQSDSMMDARLRCLERRRSAFAMTTRELLDGGSDLLPHSLQMVESLPPIESCADREWVSSSLPPPEDATLASAVEEVREGLERARVLRAAGRYAEGLEVALEEEKRAATLDYVPLRAEAALVTARLRQETAEYEEAESEFRRAFFEGRRSGHDEIAARASIWLVALVGDRLRRQDDGLEWAEHARAEVDRRPDPRLAADLDAHLGSVYYTAGEFDRAVELQTRALGARREIFGEGHPEVARSLDALGRVLYRQGEYDAAMENHRAALDILVEALGPQHPELGGTLSAIGNVQYRQKRLDEALETYREALAIRSAALGENHHGVAVSLNNIGNVYDSRRDYPAALEVYERAAKILADVLGEAHPDYASALANVANCHEAMEDLDSALELHTRALEIKQAALGEDHPSLGYSHNGLGTVLFKRGDYSEALGAYQRALDIWEKKLGTDHPLLAYALWGIGKTELELRRPEAAVTALSRAISIRSSHGSPPDDLAQPRFGMARALWMLGDRSAAVALADRAREEFDQGGDEENAAEVRRWLRLHAR